MSDEEKEPVDVESERESLPPCSIMELHGVRYVDSGSFENNLNQICINKTMLKHVDDDLPIMYTASYGSERDDSYQTIHISFESKAKMDQFNDYWFDLNGYCKDVRDFLFVLCKLSEEWLASDLRLALWEKKEEEKRLIRSRRWPYSMGI